MPSQVMDDALLFALMSSQAMDDALLFFLIPATAQASQKGCKTKKAAGEEKKPPRRVGQRQDPAPGPAFIKSKRKAYKHCP
ncbi:hypothetical protein AVEN_57526-1 [Araneus ventricosus]|uniref:Uncharacterized protein n=1 Tax=Araneus ventricosus TaxID=182803 RepID=A0A4Y2W1I4_ARAVE|nr:hypothetical protein AVEN_57526-1 [Araneus ventricosus]